MTTPSSTRAYDHATVPSFDRIAAEVVPGAGLVARSAGVVLVLAEPIGDRGWREAETLIGLVAEISGAAPRAPGLALTGAAAAWHRSQPSVSFGLLAATEDGLALCLSGTAEAGLPETGHRLTAAAEGGWLTRQLGWTDAQIVVSLTGDAAADLPSQRLVLDLHSGVVPGSAVRLASPAAGDSAAAADQVQRLDQLPPPPPPAVAEAPAAAPELALPPQARASSLFGASAAEPSRTPLPVAAAEAASGAGIAHDPGHPHAHPPAGAQPGTDTAGTPPDVAAGDGVVVDGFLCSRGHLNDPRGHFCAQCGIRMAELTGIITKGRRPPLGLLLFDNGATFVLDHDYLIGRDPESDPQVQSGAMRPLVLLDAGGGISRQHAEIRLQGWDVVLIDRGSANGTLVALRDEPQWRAVVPGQPIGLLPGMRVSMGRRTLSFETPHRTT